MTAFIPEEKEFELLDSGGMGLNLIRQCVSSMRYERKEDRNVLTLLFPLPSSSEYPNPRQQGEFPAEI